MVCESARPSWTAVNWAVQDQSPESRSCRGFSPRWKSLTRPWCCFDWRQRSVVLVLALSVFNVLHIWPLTAWTPQAATQRKWWFKECSFLCLLARPAGCFLHWIAQKAELERALVLCRCGGSKDVNIRAMRTHQPIVADELSHSFLLWAQFHHTKSA